MKKIKNIKKKTIYTVLLVIIAVLVVGYAVLSSTLNIFGGLGIIPGDLGWGVKWSNLEVNAESNATVNTAPTIVDDDTSVNFVVTLDQPGKFYEFTVDAVNTGTIDAMIDGVNTTIYNSEDEDVYPDYLNYSVEYANGVNVTPGHLLRAGESVKYKVRIEFSNDITVEDLPTQEEQLRFEFGVTYIQADEGAFEPGTLSRIQNMIIVSDTDYFSDVNAIKSLFEDNYYILYTYGLSFSSTSGGGVDLQAQTDIKDYVEEYGAENVVIVLASKDEEYLEMMAETFTMGDPTFLGPLSGVSLRAPVYHLFDYDLYDYYNDEVFSSSFAAAYNNEEKDIWVQAVANFRYNYSIKHNI